MIDGAHSGEFADGGYADAGYEGAGYEGAGYEGAGYEGGGYEGEAHGAASDAAPDGAGAAGMAGTAGTAAGELPDLLGLDLAALRTLDHPVLSEVMADLRGRAEQPREMLWGFNNAF
ncbi:FxSxx-COOH cyclophane-containing RiPP peptide [Streptomyces sp. NPDC087851]|uniref:FxSxx-COOH cyclophane-containing RiPP peptide n=1 Tax=Streptomyces sp. NPDC087851 TaxID=3365810 RepID=UPI0038199558